MILGGCTSPIIHDLSSSGSPSEMESEMEPEYVRRVLMLRWTIESWSEESVGWSSSKELR